jgi:hypothetical protein
VFDRTDLKYEEVDDSLDFSSEGYQKFEGVKQRRRGENAPT